MRSVARWMDRPRSSSIRLRTAATRHWAFWASCFGLGCGHPRDAGSALRLLHQQDLRQRGQHDDRLVVLRWRPRHQLRRPRRGKENGGSAEHRVRHFPLRWRWRELNSRPTMHAQVFSGCSPPIRCFRLQRSCGQVADKLSHVSVPSRPVTCLLSSGFLKRRQQLRRKQPQTDGFRSSLRRRGRNRCA